MHFNCFQCGTWNFHAFLCLLCFVFTGWLHIETPACYAEKQYEGYSRDISVRKTVKEKIHNSSSDALNLLAELALSASNDHQVSPHPPQEHLGEPESSLKKFDITDATSAEQESVLPAFLRQPAARTIEPPAPSLPHLVGERELVDVISREHAYSLPLSSSLLLTLPAPFQVSHLNGSTRLPHHSQKLLDGFSSQQPFISPDVRVEHDKRTAGDLKKQTWCRRKKVRHSRTIVNKHKTFQVTRHWKESYDFSLDSRFIVDPKEEAIVRALHGYV